MQLPEYLTIETDYALLCPRGQSTFDAPADIIDPRKFAVTAAHNLALSVDVFTSRQQALSWLPGKAAE